MDLGQAVRHPDSGPKACVKADLGKYLTSEKPLILKVRDSYKSTKQFDIYINRKDKNRGPKC
jgi:hypothetical protein